MLNVYAARSGQMAGTALPLAADCYLLDLPGYGYARAGQAQRAAFLRLLMGVLRRPRLAGIVWLLDVRHEPSAEDRVMQDRLIAAGTPVLAALTKGDKLPRGARVRRATALQAATGLDVGQMLVTSARNGEGVAELRTTISALVQGGHHAASA